MEQHSLDGKRLKMEVVTRGNQRTKASKMEQMLQGLETMVR